MFHNGAFFLIASINPITESTISMAFWHPPELQIPIAIGSDANWVDLSNCHVQKLNRK